MTQKDTTTALTILKIFTSRPTIILSWGFSSPRAIENGLRFRVYGFIYQGLCDVVYDEGADTFTFRTVGKDGQVLDELDGLYIDNLVDTIDRTVETGGDIKEYLEAVGEWLDNDKD